MISRKTIVALVLIVSIGAFAIGAYVYKRNAQAEQQAVVISQSEHLVRRLCRNSGAEAANGR